MKYLLACAFAVAIGGCSGSSHHDSDTSDANDSNDPQHVVSLPYEAPQGLVPETSPPIAARVHTRDIECVADPQLCDAKRTECEPGKPDDPEHLTPGGAFYDDWWKKATDAKATVDRLIEITANTLSPDTELDLNGYNSVPGYTIKLSCENASWAQKGHVDSTVGTAHCKGGEQARRIRYEVVRSETGEKVWEGEVTSGGGVRVGDANTSKSRSLETSTISVEGGALQLTWALAYQKKGPKSPGTSRASLYLTFAQDTWMEQIATKREEFRSMPLRRWTLPGAHDAGMYTHHTAAKGEVIDGLSGIFGANRLAMTQELSIGEQLEAGIRYFDLRPADWRRLSLSEKTLNFLGEKPASGPLTAQDVVMAHGIFPGGKFETAVADALSYLKGNKEIAIFRISGSGLPKDTAAPKAILEAIVKEQLERAGLAASFVGGASDLDRSFSELTGPTMPRLIILYGGETLDSWSEAKYTDAKNIPLAVREAANACSMQKNHEHVANVFQLQLTPSSEVEDAAAQLISNTLLNPKLGLDREFLPWIAAGGASGCLSGPTIVSNDYVDNALTDAVARGAFAYTGEYSAKARPPTKQMDPYTTVSNFSWSGSGQLATKSELLTLQPDGNLVLYAVQRETDGTICRRKATWSSETVGSGARAVFDGNLTVYDGNGQVKWENKAKGLQPTQLTLGNGMLAIVAKDKSSWQVPVAASLESCADKSDTQTWLPGTLRLLPGDAVRTNSERLTLQSDGNAVLYRVAYGSDGEICRQKYADWSTGGGGAELKFTTQGQLELLSGANVKWNSGTAGKGAKLALQADGNFVIYDAAGAAIWSSNTMRKDKPLTCSGG